MGCCTSSHSLKVISSRTLAHNWLTRTPLFLHLTHAQLDYLSAAFSSVTYEAGDVIAERGAADDTLCLVSAGSIGFIQPPSEDGQSQRRSLVALSAEGDELVMLPGQVGGSETEQVRRGSTASGHDASEAGSSVAGVDVAATSGGGAQPKLGKLSLLIRSRMKAHVEKIRSLGLETQSDAGSGGEGAGNDGLDSAARRAVRGTLKRKHNLAEVLNAKRVKPKSDDGLGMTTVVPTAQPRAEQPHVQPMMPLEEADDEESDAGGSNRTGTVISDGMSELDDTIRMRRRISEEHGAILTVKSAGAFFGHTIGESATHANKIVALDNTTLLAATHEQLLGIVGRDVQFREALLAGLGEGSKVEQYLSQLTLFNDIPREKLSVVASMLHFVPLDEEEVLFEEGDDNPEGNSLYILHTGTCQARTKKEPPVVLNEFHSGQFFGEIGLLINVPRTARIVATSRCLLMELKPDDFWSFVTLNTSPMLISNLTQLLKLRTADSFRRFKIPLFASVPADKYQLLGHNCRIMQLEANEVVFREDDVGSDFYLILHGRVLVTSAKKVDGKDEAHVICELSDGNYFGEAALLRQQTRNATITCITRTVLIALKLEDFAAFCDHVPGVREACEARLALYEIDMHTVLYDRDAQALFRRHLEREIAVENLDFWNAAREFMLKWRAAGFSKRRASMHDIGANLENNVLLRGEELGQSPQVKPKTLTEQSSSQLMDQLQRRRMCTEARRIVDKYVREDSPYWINLSGAVRDELVSLVDKAHACDPRIAALPDAPESICAESFDKAQHEVQDLMTRDPFRRFKQSSLFQDLVALLDAKRSSALPAQATSANPSPAASRSPSIQRSRSRASSRSNGSWTDKIREFNQSLLNDRSFGERSHSDRLEAPVPPGSAPNSPRQRSSRGSSSRTERMRRVLDMSKQSPS